MIAKEKAEELVDRFINYSYFSDGNNSMNRQYQQEDNAKECALIAVEEILNTLYSIPFGNALDNELEYWEEVKQEIENK